MACCAPQPFGVSEPRENWTWEPREISISSFDEGGASVTAEAPVRLPRGGLLVQTSIGAIQFGAPPETIKDILLAQPPLPTPSIYVVPDPLFCPLRHVNLVCCFFPFLFSFSSSKSGNQRKWASVSTPKLGPLKYTCSAARSGSSSTAASGSARRSSGSICMGPLRVSPRTTRRDLMMAAEGPTIVKRLFS